MMKWCVALLCCVGACDLGSSASQVSSDQALSANPCTAVALTTPGQAFTAQVGQPIALSASATCPAGQTPEFEYWTKAPTDSNWVTTAIGGYVPAGATFTPTVAGGLCFSVVTRAIGSTDTYQARSSGACGTVTGSVTPPSATITRVVPIVPPGIFGPLMTSSMTVSGLGSSTRALFVQLPTTVGETITGLRARVTDAPGTSVEVILVRTSDNSESFAPIAASPGSAGDGSEQTVSAALASLVDVHQQYTAIVADLTGGATASVWRLEMDTTPAQ